MQLNDAEKKRRSWAKKSAKYHDHERETSWKCMAIYRAKDKAQKRAQMLKNLLSEEDGLRINSRVAKQRKWLIAECSEARTRTSDPS